MVQPADPNRNDVQTMGGETAEADDPRIAQALEEYLAEADAGRRPNRREFVARHPQIATELSACLHGMAFLNSAIDKIKDESDAGGAGRSAVASDPGLIVGQPLGDFRLIREIGRGGMGVVYEAEQLSLGRHVALKILPMAAALDARHLQRFRNEAQAAAALHHTNIVPVYAVGSERSLHYYAMQLIDGQSLADVIGELRGDPARPGGGSSVPTATERPLNATYGPQDQTIDWSPPPALKAFQQAADATPPRPAGGRSGGGDEGNSAPASFGVSSRTYSVEGRHSPTALRTLKRAEFYRTVARLGLQAAEALEYAHQRGVVHRDVKPGNLLLDLRGNLWITDFGLAQVFSTASDLTQPGDVIGTFRYMSPEQSSGKAVVLDQRADVYSLGATLYELLTLHPALDGKSREELLRQIDEVDPKPARAHDKQIPPELETILGKAMAKSADERYQSAGEMAEDLRRFLADEPIHARPPTAWDRMVKWTRRHKPLAGAAVAALVVIAVVSSVSAILIARAQGHTQDAYFEEKRRAVEAERSALAARQVVGFFTRFAADQMPLDPQFVPLRRRMLEEGMRYYEQFVAETRNRGRYRNDPVVQAELKAATEWADAALAELNAVDEIGRAMFDARLLQVSGVKTDLGLSDSQAKTILGAAQNLDRGARRKPVRAKSVETDDGRSIDHAEETQLLQNQAADRRKAIEDNLSPEQVQRLKELSRQARGIFALSDSDSSTLLALTAPQRESLRAAEASLYDTHAAGRGGSRGGPPGRDRIDAALQKVLGQLSESQQQTWASLVGRPFKGTLPVYSTRLGGGPVGPGGPGGGPGGPGGPPGFGGPPDFGGPPGPPPDLEFPDGGFRRPPPPPDGGDFGPPDRGGPPE